MTEKSEWKEYSMGIALPESGPCVVCLARGDNYDLKDHIRIDTDGVGFRCVIREEARKK